MATRYEIGQKVIIKQANNPASPVRDCTVEPYSGQVGEISNFHWILPPAGEIFYIYTVQVGKGHDEIILYEDEIQSVRK